MSVIVEDWTLLDSLYFSVITASTVGFGDFTPETDIGKIYTMIYVLVTTGLLLLVLSRVATEMIANRVETTRPTLDTNELAADDGKPTGVVRRSPGGVEPTIGSEPRTCCLRISLVVSAAVRR